jgi:hypothetical protein
MHPDLGHHLFDLDIVAGVGITAAPLDSASHSLPSPARFKNRRIRKLKRPSSTSTE